MYTFTKFICSIGQHKHESKHHVQNTGMHLCVRVDVSNFERANCCFNKFSCSFICAILLDSSSFICNIFLDSSFICKIICATLTLGMFVSLRSPIFIGRDEPDDNDAPKQDIFFAGFNRGGSDAFEVILKRGTMDVARLIEEQSRIQREGRENAKLLVP